MKTIQTSQQAGPDGKLRLENPVDKVGHTYHVLVILDEQSAESRSAGEWPPGYLDSTIGRWQGDFVYESEGPFERMKQTLEMWRQSCRSSLVSASPPDR
jgi:hypothetical protein